LLFLEFGRIVYDFYHLKIMAQPNFE